MEGILVGLASDDRRHGRAPPQPRPTDVGYARSSSSTGMVRMPAVFRSYSAKPG
jgi:hypothetical protein